jgi:hypothetical protein
MGGETLITLSKEFKVSKSAISEKFQEFRKKNLELAENLAIVESRVESLPRREQAAVRTLADQLKGVAMNLTLASDAGARTAKLLQDKAHRQAEMINEELEGGLDDPESHSRERLRAIHALHSTANEAARPGLEMLKLAKGTVEREAEPQQQGGPIDFSTWSDEDLAEYLRLMKKNSIDSNASGT